MTKKGILIIEFIIMKEKWKYWKEEATIMIETKGKNVGDIGENIQ